MRMSSRTGLGLVAFWALCSTALAGDAAPPADAVAFVTRASQAGMSEVAAAEVALKISKDPATQTFARKMITDHRRAASELQAVAKAKSIAVPSAPAPEQAARLEALKVKQGKAFDAAYAALMVEWHGEAVELFQANVANPDGEIAAYAGKTLPALQEHQRLAENLESSLPH